MIEVLNPYDWIKSQGIYLLKNNFSGKIYVGSAGFSTHPETGRITSSLSSRIRCHLSFLRNGKHPNRYLQGSWNKHGPDVFKFYILEIVQGGKEEILRSEQGWIEKLNACDPSIGFNLAVKADCPMRGRRHTEEAKKKIAEAAAKFRLDGRKRNRDYVMSPEQKLKLSQLFKGRTHSEETKRKISEKTQGKWVSRDSILRMKIGRKGFHPSADAIKRQADALRGRKRTEKDLQAIKTGRERVFRSKVSSMIALASI